jgi:transcriptional regulator with XRE-family HTH domain
MTSSATTRTREARGIAGTYARIVHEICRVLSAREVAEAVGVGERTVQNWRAGTTQPRGGAREALLDLHFVVDALSDVYTEEGVEVVLRGRAKTLNDRRPLEVFASGDRETVVRLAGQLRDYG